MWVRFPCFFRGVPMKITEYLDAKYGFVSNTMTGAEARIFGIPYPLRNGWRTTHGEREIDTTMRYRLVQSLSMSSNRYAPCGLEALGEKAATNAAPFSKQVKKLSKKRERKRQKLANAIAAFEARQKGIAPVKPEKKKRIAKTVAQHIRGINVASDDFLQTYEWRRVRMEALKKYGRTCQCCGASPATGAVMNVDHIKPRRLFPQLALDLDNLQVLCHECNHGKGNWDMTDWRPDELTDADRENIAHLRSI